VENGPSTGWACPNISNWLAENNVDADLLHDRRWHDLQRADESGKYFRLFDDFLSGLQKQSLAAYSFIERATPTEKTVTTFFFRSDQTRIKRRAGEILIRDTVRMGILKLALVGCGNLKKPLKPRGDRMLEEGSGLPACV